MKNEFSLFINTIKKERNLKTKTIAFDSKLGMTTVNRILGNTGGTSLVVAEKILKGMNLTWMDYHNFLNRQKVDKDITRATTEMFIHKYINASTLNALN